jgi:Glycosyltransferase family 87
MTLTQLQTERPPRKNRLTTVIELLEKKRQLVIVGTATVLIAVNVLIFISAYPTIFVPKAANYASDFSAYYIGVWRLFHAPSFIYAGSSVPGEYVILPYVAAFKYLPSFLLIASPLILTSYQNAFVLFDVFQLILLPLMTYMIYELLEGRSALLISVVFFFALLQPFIPSYYWQWSQGQDKVLQTFLLVLTFYLGKKGKFYLSGIVFGLSFFDPRFALVSIPLFVLYNRGRIAASSIVAGITFVLSNFLVLVAYPGAMSGFLSMLFSFGLSTPLYIYSFIPLLTVGALTLANWRGFLSAGREILVASRQRTLGK